MKRVLSLVLALVLVLGSMPLAFADDHMTAGDMLYDWGLIEGYSATEKQLGEEDTLTRAQMMKLLAEVMGEEEQAAAYPGSFFTDLVEGDTLNSYVNYAASKGWTTGVGDMMFNPAGEVSQEMAATFMMRALGYEPVWGQATAAVAALGIVVPVNNAGELTRGEVFQYMVASLNTDTTDGVKLGAKLGVEGFEAEEPVVEAEELEVVSVDATNLIEVIVEFNQDVTDNEEVADKENYEVDLEDIDKVTVDGNVVVIKLDAGVDNQEDAVLTVSDEILAEEEEFEFTFFDAELPEVLGLTVTGPKTFEIEFSEPIETGGNVTVKSGSSTLSVNKAQITGVGSTTMTVPMFSTMKDDTTYTVTVKEFADYAGYNNIVKSLEFTYVKDVTPPEATIVEATQEYVLVKFSKPVKGLTPNHFSHTFSAWKSLKITEDDEFTSTAVTHTDAVSEVYVWFYGDDSNNERPIPAGENEFKILSKADDSSDNSRTIKDNWDNEFATTTIAFSVTADLTAPEVKEIKVDSEDTLTIEFTKNVVFDEDNVEVLLDDGSEIDDLDLSVTVLTADKKFEISLGADTDLSGETIVITISDVEDKTLNANVMPDYSETIEITDKTDPVVNDVTYEVEDETGFIYVFFNEDMDSDTTLVSGNYFLYDGTTYRKLSEEIEFSNGNKVVKIELTSTQKGYVDGAAYGKLLVTNVEDLNGNEIVPSLTTIVDHSTYSPAIYKVEATAVDTIEVTFTQELGDVDMDGFRLRDNSTTSAAVDTDVEFTSMDISVNSDGVTVLTFKLSEADELPFNVGTRYVSIVDEAKVKNLFGVDATATAISVVDKIKPEVLADEDDAFVATGSTITIVFEEDLDTTNASLFAQDLVIKNGSDTLVAGVDYTTTIVDGSKISISFPLLDAGDYSLDLKSKDSITYIKDDSSEKNKAVPFTDWIEDLEITIE